MGVRKLGDDDRPWLRDLVARRWGLPVVSVSGAYDPSTLPGFVADGEDGPLGVVTYRLGETECEVVTLNSFAEGRGTGTALLAAVQRLADERQARLWLITTNDNVNAIRFYQRRGMDVRALHRDFVERVRQEKPVPDGPVGDGVPFRHALEFSYEPTPGRDRGSPAGRD